MNTWYRLTVSHHEANVLSNEVGSKNLNWATVKCAMWRIGCVIPHNCSWSKPLSLKCDVWLVFWNNDLFTAVMKVLMYTAILLKTKRKKKVEKSINSLVNSRVDPYYGSFLAKNTDCIDCRLHHSEVAATVAIDA